MYACVAFSLPLGPFVLCLELQPRNNISVDEPMFTENANNMLLDEQYLTSMDQLHVVCITYGNIVRKLNPHSQSISLGMCVSACVRTYVCGSLWMCACVRWIDQLKNHCMLYDFLSCASQNMTWISLSGVFPPRSTILCWP